MKVLVAIGSRHGSTLDIAEEMARRLREALVLLGEQPGVDVRQAGAVDHVSGYDAVVLGSAVYHGRWLEAAHELAERERHALCARPVWLFSCGVSGSPATVCQDAAELSKLMRLTGAHQHRGFAGLMDWRRLDAEELSRAMELAAGFGDHRDWAGFRHWADTIATTLWAARALDPYPVR